MSPRILFFFPAVAGAPAQSEFLFTVDPEDNPEVRKHMGAPPSGKSQFLQPRNQLDAPFAFNPPPRQPAHSQPAPPHQVPRPVNETADSMLSHASSSQNISSHLTDSNGGLQLFLGVLGVCLVVSSGGYGVWRWLEGQKEKDAALQEAEYMRFAEKNARKDAKAMANWGGYKHMWGQM